MGEQEEKWDYPCPRTQSLQCSGCIALYRCSAFTPCTAHPFCSRGGTPRYDCNPMLYPPLPFLFQTALMFPAAPPCVYLQASHPYPVALPYAICQATSSSQLPSQGTSFSYPLAVPKPLTRGTQAALSPNLQWSPNAGFPRTTDAASFFLTQVLNPVSAPVPPPKKGRGREKGKRKSKPKDGSP